MRAGRADPKIIKQPLDKSLQRVKENSFAVGHIPYNSNTKRCLQPFKIILLDRNIHDAVMSHMIFQIESGRCDRYEHNRVWSQEPDPQQQFLKFLDVCGDNAVKKRIDIQLWSSEPILHVRYEDIKRDPIDQINLIASYLDVRCDASAIAERSFGKDTVTISHIQDRDKYWSEEAKGKINQLMEKHDSSRN